MNRANSHENAPTSARDENRPITRREPRTQTARLLGRVAAACVYVRHPTRGNDLPRAREGKRPVAIYHYSNEKCLSPINLYSMNPQPTNIGFNTADISFDTADICF